MQQYEASQRSLPDPCVEVEIPLQAPKPIRGVISPVDGRHRVRGHLDLDAVPPAQLGPVLPIEVDQGRGGPRVAGDVAAQHDVVGEDHGAEAEHVGADGRHEDGGDCRMDDGAARGHGVGRGPRRRREDDAIGLDRREVDVVAEAFLRREGGAAR